VSRKEKGKGKGRKGNGEKSTSLRKILA